MKTLLRSLLASSLLAFVAACGGGSDTPATTGGSPNLPGAPGVPGVTSELPIIYITTAGNAPVVNTEDYVDGTVTVLAATGEQLLQAPTEVRGRGNTTWGMPKKPYRLKLNEAAPMLGMPAERDWNLLANYADKSMARNMLAMSLGEDFGFSYTPRSVFAEMYFNGEYQGVYQIFEHVKVGANRVNVEKLDRRTDTDPAIISGGHFLEIDHRFDEDVCWLTSLSIPICSKDPEYDAQDAETPGHPSNLQFNYIRNYVNAAEASLSATDNSYVDYFDVDSAVNFYLLNELLKTNDAQINSYAEGGDRFTSSVFLHKTREGKLTFGPLWDFDIAAGNINYNGNEAPQGWWIRNGVWHSLLFNNTDFGNRVHAKWCSLMRDGTIPGLDDRVDDIVAEIDRDAIDRNFERWDILGENVWPNFFVGNTYEEEVDYLKDWIAQRAAWMNSALVEEYGACPAN